MLEKSGAWVLPAASVAVLAALVAAFWGPVVSLILQPLAWLLWAGWRVLASVDPEIWWVIVALACAVSVIRLFDAQLRSQDESDSGDAVQPGPGGRVEAPRVEMSSLGDDAVTNCVSKAAVKTTIAGATPGQRLSIPLHFRSAEE